MFSVSVVSFRRPDVTQFYLTSISFLRDFSCAKDSCLTECLVIVQQKNDTLTTLSCSYSSCLSLEVFDAVYNDGAVVWPCNWLPCFGGDGCSSGSEISALISSLASELSPLLPQRLFDCGPSSVFVVGSSTPKLSVSNVLNAQFLRSSGRGKKLHSWQVANTAKKYLQGYWYLFQDSQIQLAVEIWTRCNWLELEVLFTWNSPFTKFTGDTSHLGIHQSGRKFPANCGGRSRRWDRIAET